MRDMNRVEGRLGSPARPSIVAAAVLVLLLLGPLACEDPLRPPASPGPFLAVSAGGTHSCAVAERGRGWCWGAGDVGQLGTGDGEGAATPQPLKDAPALVGIAAGLRHSCALADDGSAHCWGWNPKGQLGVGSSFNHSFPFPVKGGLRFAALSAGWFHTCGVTLAGEAFCWGGNGQGQLGDGSVQDSPVPVRVEGGVSWAAVSAGAHHTCGLDVDGGAWCWGGNNTGQLGAGGTANALQPVRVSGGGVFTHISAGFSHTCGVHADGVALCWGGSAHGELGSRTRVGPGEVASGVPAPVFGPERYRDIDAGLHVTCAVTTRSTLECWGRGADGQLGDPLLPDRATPQPVRPTDRASFTAVSVSPAGHACALAQGGGVYCWGRGPEGQLGVPSTSFSITPARVTRLD